MQDFRKLNVWRRSHRLALAVYAEAHDWSKHGHGAIAAQTRRAAMSISANITEGCGARGAREFQRYLHIALASATELDYHLLFAHDAAVMPKARFEALTVELMEVRAMLAVLIRRVREQEVAEAVPRKRKVAHAAEAVLLDD